MKLISPNEPEEGEERAAGFVLFRTVSGSIEFLLLRHQDGGHWSFPKGRLEPGEGELEAALREVFEETSIEGLQPIPGFRDTSAYRLTRDGRTISKTVVYFLAEVMASAVRLSTEHLDYQWLPADAAEATLTYPESRRILRAASETLRQRTAVQKGEGLE